MIEIIESYVCKDCATIVSRVTDKYTCKMCGVYDEETGEV
jgi:DNA-directed RNA polymerase subunit RPC12/RpoP